MCSSKFIHFIHSFIWSASNTCLKTDLWSCRIKFLELKLGFCVNISTIFRVPNATLSVRRKEGRSYSSENFFKSGPLSPLPWCAPIRADPGICERGRAVPPVLFLFLLFFFPLSLFLPLDVARPARGLGSAVSSPAGVRAEPKPKTNLVHSDAARKPLVAIILNILSTMFYSRTIKI